MKNLRTVIITGLMLTALPALANETTTASLPKDGTKPVCEGKSCSMKFKLTDEQRTKIGALVDKYKLDNANKKAELKVSYRQLREIMGKPSIDKSAALATESKINGLKSELATSKLNLKLAMADVFSPEQRAEWLKFKEMKEHRFHGGHRFGMHREGGRDFGPKPGTDKA